MNLRPKWAPFPHICNLGGKSVQKVDNLAPFGGIYAKLGSFCYNFIGFTSKMAPISPYLHLGGQK